MLSVNLIVVGIDSLLIIKRKTRKSTVSKIQIWVKKIRMVIFFMKLILNRKMNKIYFINLKYNFSGSTKIYIFFN